MTVAELIAYAARTGTKRNLAGLRELGWRLLISAAGVQQTEGFEDLGIALDNGAWSARGTGEYPDRLKRLFIRLVVMFGSLADWTVPPDIVAGGASSLNLSLRWMPWVLKHCYPMPFRRTPELVGFARWIVGAYDKRIPWPDWVAARLGDRRTLPLFPPTSRLDDEGPFE